MPSLAEILNIIANARNIVATVNDLIDQLKETGKVLSQEDQQALDAALDLLKADIDTTYERVVNKLRGA